MKWLAYASLTLLLVSPAGRAQDKPRETPWFPLQIGNTWTYKDSAGQRIVLKVKSYEKVDNIPTARIEMSQADKVLSSENIGVTESGVYRYRFNEQKPDKPVLVLKLPPKKGDEWKLDVKALGEPLVGTFKVDEKEVKVPAGTYKTFTVASEDLEAAKMKTPCTLYFAENVGLVKMEVKISGQDIVLELEKFEPGKK